MIVVANAITLSSSLLLAPFIARALGPTGRGEVAASVAALNILPILIGLGLPLVVRRFAALGEAGAATRTARLLVLILFIPSITIGWVLTEIVFGSMRETEQLVTWIGLALAPVTLMWMIDASALLGAERYWAVFAVRIAQPIVFALSVIGVMLTGALTVATTILLQSLANFAALAVSFASNRVTISGRRAAAGPMVREGISLAGGSIAEALSYRLDQILILPLAGAAQAGYYSIAGTLGSIPLAMAQAITAPNYRAVLAAPPDRRQEVTLQGARETISVGWVSVSAVGVLCYPLIPLLFGPDFAAAVPVTLVYLVGSLALCSASYASICLAGLRRGAVMSLGQSAAAVLGLVLLLILAPRWGAMGAASATVVTYAALATYLNSRLGLGLNSIFPSTLALRRAVRRMFSS